MRLNFIQDLFKTRFNKITEKNGPLIKKNSPFNKKNGPLTKKRSTQKEKKSKSSRWLNRGVELFYEGAPPKSSSDRWMNDGRMTR